MIIFQLKRKLEIYFSYSMFYSNRVSATMTGIKTIITTSNPRDPMDRDLLQKDLTTPF